MKDIPIKTVFIERNNRNTVQDVIQRLQRAAGISPNLIVYPDEMNNCLILADSETKKVVLQLLLD